MENLEKLLKAKIPGEETGIVIKKSLCAICNPDSHCAINAYVKDGKLIKVEGAPNPHSDGTLCAKGAATRQYVYNQDRVLYPLKRVGEKGEGQFERITWEEAYKTIADKLLGCKKEFGGRSVAFFSGFSKWYRPPLLRLATAFESPNYCSESSTCFRATQIAWKLTYGKGAAPDYQNSNLMVVWSKNPAHTQYYLSRYVMDALERGMKLIVVDPRCTPTSDRADIHLKLKPGTDGALALAMAHVLLKEGIYDKEFVEKYVHGFEDFSVYVKSFTPEKGAEITGVPAEKIVAAARMYATVKPASMMVSASPVVHHVNGVQNYRAAMCLIGLTGNFDVKGGNIIIPHGYLHTSSFVKTNEGVYQGERYHEEKGIGEEEFPAWFELVKDEVQGMRLPDYIQGKGAYPVKAVMAFGLNHRMWPDSNNMLEALKKLDFFVNTELFMTDACKYADIVLPACTSLERSEIKVYNENYLYCSEPAIAPLGEARHDIQIIFELAKALGLQDDFLRMTYDEYMDYILQPSGVSLEELRRHPEGMYAKIIQPHVEKAYEQEGFKTPSGKMELHSLVLEKYQNSHGYDPLPKYKSFYEIYPKYDNREYPFIINTGARKPQLVHTRMYRIDWITNLEDVALVDIHPTDGELLGLQQGDDIVISTPKGSVEAKANLTPTGHAGVVFMYHGNSKRDPNSLMDADYLDPISGFPGYKSYICKITKKGAQ